jgi:hypothetical protein
MMGDRDWEDKQRYKNFGGDSVRSILKESFTIAYCMDAVVEQLNEKLRQWQPYVAEQVRQCILEIIDLADRDALDLLRSRSVEQEVVDLLDKPLK